MLENFIRMPGLLKVLTLLGIFSILWVLITAFSGVNVMGHYITAAVWWESGAGVLCLFAALIMNASAILLLRRSRYGRTLHIIGWIAIILVSVFSFYLVKAIPKFLMLETIFNFVIILCIGLYLFFNRKVNSYFVN